MPKEKPEITSTKINARATIIVAIIGLLGIIATAILNPLGQKLADNPASTPNSTSLSIEKIPQDIFAYAGNNNPDGGGGTFVLINDQETIPNYKLDFSLPGEKHGYAGLAFNFHGSMNLSEYSSIECIIIFSQPRDEIDLYFKDIGSKFDTIRVVGNGTNEMSLRYEFKNFPDINFNAVKEFGIVASTDFSTGTHQVVLKNIRFTK